MHLSLKLFVVITISFLSSCNSNSSPNSDHKILPPNEIEFTTASTAKPSNNSSGFEITGTIKGRHILKQNDSSKEIELVLQFPNGKSDNKFFWTSKQGKEYLNQDMKKGILYIGKDDANAYAEVEYFYDSNDSLNMVILRSPQNNTIIILNNLLH